MSRDFDFLIGEWKIQNRFLKRRLCACTEWIEFETNSVVRPLLNDLGNVGRYTGVREGRILEGVNLRLFNPSTGEWSLHWVDNVRAGVLQPPIVGRFHGDTGEFLGNEEVDGRKVLCRSRWFRQDKNAPRWEQAFSDDAGGTWETNWVMTFARAEASNRRGFLPFESGVTTEDLLESVQSWLKPPPRRVTFRVEGKTVVLQLQEIEWVEAQRDYVLLHMRKENLLVRATMSGMEEALDPRIFRRIHRSAIVNMDYVKEIRSGQTAESSVVMRDGTVLRLSRGQYEGLLTAISAWPLPPSLRSDEMRKND